MDFTAMIKSSAKEANDFAKRNAATFILVGDLQTARDACKTNEARNMIEGLFVPLQKQLQKQSTAFDAKMTRIWKPAKGEKLPKDTQKELDNALKKSSDAIKSKSGKEVKHNTDPAHTKWIDVL
jgi:hypothetical protein